MRPYAVCPHFLSCTAYPGAYGGGWDGPRSPKRATARWPVPRGDGSAEAGGWSFDSRTPLGSKRASRGACWEGKGAISMEHELTQPQAMLPSGTCRTPGDFDHRDVLLPRVRLLTSTRWRLTTFHMLPDRAEGLGGNRTHKHFADNLVGHKRANRPPPPGEIVHHTGFFARPLSCGARHDLSCAGSSQNRFVSLLTGRHFFRAAHRYPGAENSAMTGTLHNWRTPGSRPKVSTPDWAP